MVVGNLLCNEQVTEDHFRPYISTVYYIYMGVFQIIFFIVGFFSAKKLIWELREKYIDVFKVVQMLFILWFLVARNLFMIMTQVEGFEFYFIPTLSSSLFFFYYFEIINNSWWLDTMVHIAACKDPTEMSKRALKHVRWKEILLVLFSSFLMLPVISCLIIIIILMKVHSWERYHIHIDAEIEASAECLSLLNASRILATVMFSIGVFAISSKVVIGLLMLNVMK